MGRLRDGSESPFIRCVTEEVIDLFGNEDGVLYRFDEAESEKTRDPLWDEPSFKATYKPFACPFLIKDVGQPIEVTDSGREGQRSGVIWVSRNHLLKAGVPQDDENDHVRPGDIFSTWDKGERVFWWLVEVDRRGYVNDSESWSSYECIARRTNKFVPEREL